MFNTYILYIIKTLFKSNIVYIIKSLFKLYIIFNVWCRYYYKDNIKVKQYK